MSTLAAKSNSKRGFDRFITSFFKLESFALKLPGQYKIQLKALVAEVKEGLIKQYKEILSENEWLRQQNDALIKENDSAKVNKTLEQAVVRSSIPEPSLEEVAVLPVRSGYWQKLLLEPLKQNSSQWQENSNFSLQKALLISEEASNDNSNDYSFADYLAKFSKRYDALSDFHEANNMWTYIRNYKESNEEVLQNANAFKALAATESKALSPSWGVIPPVVIAACTGFSVIGLSSNVADSEDTSQLRSKSPIEELITESEEGISEGALQNAGRALPLPWRAAPGRPMPTAISDLESEADFDDVESEGASEPPVDALIDTEAERTPASEGASARHLGWEMVFSSAYESYPFSKAETPFVVGGCTIGLVSGGSIVAVAALL